MRILEVIHSGEGVVEAARRGSIHEANGAGVVEVGADGVDGAAGRVAGVVARLDPVPQPSRGEPVGGFRSGPGGVFVGWAGAFLLECALGPAEKFDGFRAGIGVLGGEGVEVARERGEFDDVSVAPTSGRRRAVARGSDGQDVFEVAAGVINSEAQEINCLQPPGIK